MDSEGKHGFTWNRFIKFSIWFSVGFKTLVCLSPPPIFPMLWVKRQTIISFLSSYLKRWKTPRSILLGLTSSTLFSVTFMLVYLLLTCFPWESTTYMLAMIGFALITIYMTVCDCILPLFAPINIFLKNRHSLRRFYLLLKALRVCFLRGGQCWLAFQQPYFQKYRDFACSYSWLVSDRVTHIREFVFFFRKRKDVLNIK